MKARGYSLIEMLIGLGLVMALIAGIAVVAIRVDATSPEREAQDAEALLQATVNSERAVGYYTNARQRVLDDELAPAHLVVDGQLRSGWGPIDMEAFDVVQSFDRGGVMVSRTLRNAGLRLTWRSVPAKSCLEFVRRLPRAEQALLVGGRRVGGGGSLDGAATSQACAQGGDVAIEHWDGEAGEP